MSTNLFDQPSFRRLANVYAQNVRRLVVLSGAGASREVGLPDWGTFIDSLTSQYAKNAGTALAEAIIVEHLKVIDAETDPWKKVGLLKAYLNGHYEIAVRNILSPASPKLPTFHRRVWDLDPDALLSINLDGLSNLSYAALRTGQVPEYQTGFSVVRNRGALSFQRKLIVDLHGNIDTPSTWVLTDADRDKAYPVRSGTTRCGPREEPGKSLDRRRERAYVV